MNVKLIQTDQEPADNVVPLKVNRDDGGDENWLATLEVGTCFLARPKEDVVRTFNQAVQNQRQQEKPLDLMEYHVLHHGVKSSTLYLSSPTGQMHRVHVDQLRFSRQMELFEVLGVNRPDQEQEQNGTDTDGRSDPVRPSDLEGNANGQEVS